MKILLNISLARCYKDFRKPSLQRTLDFRLHLQFSGKLPLPCSSPPNQLFLKKCWRLCLSLLFEHSWESERLLKHQAQCNTSCCLKMLHLGHLTAKNFWTLPSLTLNILSVAAPLWEFWKIHPTRSWVHIKSCWIILTREDLCRNQNHSFPLLRDPNISRLFDTAAKKAFFFL